MGRDPNLSESGIAERVRAPLSEVSQLRVEDNKVRLWSLLKINNDTNQESLHPVLQDLSVRYFALV